MMKIEVAAHAWRYDRILAYHLSSFLLHPPADPSAIHVTSTIFYSREDVPTVETLTWFQRQQWPAGVEWRHWPLETRELCHRAIGRNKAAKATQADWLWFADIDYLIGPGTLDAMPGVLAVVAEDCPLVYPRYVTRHTSDEEGDRAIEAVKEPGIYSVDYGAGRLERNRRAIGGVQIVRGDKARVAGYCGWHEGYQTPVDTWHRTKEDRVFRHELGTSGHPIELPNVFRMCHSRKGRNDANCRN